VVAGFGEQAPPASAVGFGDGDPFAEHPSGWGERLAGAVGDELANAFLGNFTSAEVASASAG
jgi:hypothetical protein